MKRLTATILVKILRNETSGSGAAGAKDPLDCGGVDVQANHRGF